MTCSPRPGRRVPRLFRRLVPLALALALPTVAMADPKDDARRHFAAGLKAAQDGDYEIALQRFLAAQEAYPHPATLYNIAKAYQDLDDIENALIYYRMFREASPDKAADVDPIVAVLEARASAPQSVATGPASSAPAPSGGPVRVVVTGPTLEELARIEAIAAELQALKEAIQARTEADVAAIRDDQRTGGVVDGGSATGGLEDLGGPPDLPDLPEVPALPEGGFLTDAYEKIVVTASRVGQDPLDSPSTLTVLTEDDIHLSGVSNLPDLLRRVVGVDVMALSAGHSDLSIRGFNRKLANKVLVLIDGRSTYLDFAAVTFPNLLPVQLEEIERIEVIRGPGSAMYGANAVTGVINIITRTPGEKPGNLITTDVGHPGYVRTAILSSGRTGNVSYRLSGGYHQMGRWAKEFQEGKNDHAVDYYFDNQDRALQAFKAHGRIDGTFGEKGFASISGGMAIGQFEYYNIGALPNYGYDATSTYLRGDLAWGSTLLRAFWNAAGGHTGQWFETEGQARSLDSPVDNDAVDLELSGPITFSTGAVDHVLNLGVGYRYKRIAFAYMKGGFETPYTEHHFNVFANEQATIGRLGLVGSLRVDRHPLLKLSETISPRGAVIYRLFENTSVRATAGTAFRAPASLESYMDWNLTNPAADGVFIRDVGGSDVIGTTPLRPERINTFEIGLHDESSYFHTADVVVYLNQVRDLIALAPMSPTVVPYDMLNNGFLAGETGWVNDSPTYTGVGVEGELEIYPTDGMDLFANVNVMRVTERDPETGEVVADKSASPLKVNAGFSYRTPYRTDLSMAAHYLSAQTWRERGFGPDGSIVISELEVPARVLVSARIGVRPLKDDSLELAGSVWNVVGLLGNPSIEHPSGQPVGGMAFGSVTYRF